MYEVAQGASDERRAMDRLVSLTCAETACALVDRATLRTYAAEDALITAMEDLEVARAELTAATELAEEACRRAGATFDDWQGEAAAWSADAGPEPDMQIGRDYAPPGG
jgi:hypothetical protein